jgi:hypothetical protein
MLEGICHECRLHYHGWALNYQRNQICLKCGSALEIRSDGVLVRSVFTPFKAGEYRFSVDQEEWEDLCAKNLLFYLTMN